MTRPNPSTNFDFNFDDAPAQQQPQQPDQNAGIDLDELLSGGRKKSTSFAAKQAGIELFNFDAENGGN